MAKLEIVFTANIFLVRIMMKILIAHLWVLTKLGLKDIEVDIKHGGLWIKRTFFATIKYKLKYK